MAYRFSPCAPCCFTCNVPMPADDEILTAEFGFTMEGVVGSLHGTCNAGFCITANGLWGAGFPERPAIAYFTETVDYVLYFTAGSFFDVPLQCGSQARLYARIYLIKPGGVSLNCINLNPPLGSPGGNTFVQVGLFGASNIAGSAQWTCEDGESDMFQCSNTDSTSFGACKFLDATVFDFVRVDI